MYVIYKATNKINNKSYIGIDSNWPRRKTSHKHNALKKNSKLTFHKAIRKYNWESFDWEIIFESSDKNYTLKIMEPFLIAAYDTFKNGYNMTEGGEGTAGWKPSAETKKKISNGNKEKIPWNKGISCSEETKRKISEKNKNRKMSEEAKLKLKLIDRTRKKETTEKMIITRRKNNKGIWHSEETKKKISEKAKARPLEEWRLNLLRNNGEKMKETGHTEESKKKISNALKGKPKSKEHIEKIKKQNRDFMKTTKYRETMSKAKKGQKMSEEAKLKLSETKKKQYQNPDFKEKMLLSKQQKTKK